eukprot:scaffold67915_cov20-Tisochrysis_lutea.AAC.1
MLVLSNKNGQSATVEQKQYPSIQQRTASHLTSMLGVLHNDGVSTKKRESQSMSSSLLRTRLDRACTSSLSTFQVPIPSKIGRVWDHLIAAAQGHNWTRQWHALWGLPSGILRHIDPESAIPKYLCSQCGAVVQGQSDECRLSSSSVGWLYMAVCICTPEAALPMSSFNRELAEGRSNLGRELRRNAKEGLRELRGSLQTRQGIEEEKRRWTEGMD